jgi:hypothetical protein
MKYKVYVSEPAENDLRDIAADDMYGSIKNAGFIADTGEEL